MYDDLSCMYINAYHVNVVMVHIEVNTPMQGFMLNAIKPLLTGGLCTEHWLPCTLIVSYGKIIARGAKECRLYPDDHCSPA